MEVPNTARRHSQCEYSVRSGRRGSESERQRGTRCEVEVRGRGRVGGRVLGSGLGRHQEIESRFREHPPPPSDPDRDLGGQLLGFLTLEVHFSPDPARRGEG